MKQILVIYYVAAFICLLPFISLGLFILDQFIIHKTEMLFWLFFLIGLLPCGIIGFILSLVGIRISRKKENTLNKIIGRIGIAGSLLMVGGGILGILLIYVVVG